MEKLKSFTINSYCYIFTIIFYYDNISYIRKAVFKVEKQISLEQIKEFSEIYKQDKTNKIIENVITKNGLENACIDRNIIIENQPVFNIELPKSKRYDQKESAKCWIYGGLNLIKYNVAENLDINVIDLELSSNYIAFFDKLEKSNNTYENIINLENISYDYINKEKILKFCVVEGGYWSWFIAIINKYGIVPNAYMPNSVEGENYKKIDDIFFEKVKKDVIELLNLKQKEENVVILREVKNKFLQENYTLLSKILGEPLSHFDFEYKTKKDEYKRYNNLTPIEFKNKFLTLELNDFVTIGNMPMYNKEYYKIYKKKYLANVYENSYVEYLNLPIEDLKNLSIKQLKDGYPVYMGAHIMKFRDKKSGVLDTRLYNYEQTLNLNRLSKEEALNLRDISMHHVMTFTGVNIIDNKPQRWKIEDSYGDKEKVDGCYIMNDNFFSEFVLSVIIHKRYLSEEQLEMLEQEPIEYEIEEPF